MKFSSSSILVAGAFCAATCSAQNDWRAPLTTDKRSPCPMVNSLANHGFLPRDGREITLQALKDGFKQGANLAESATEVVGGKALSTSTTGNPETFNLDDLKKHPGFLEHDASLSRQDTFFGDNAIFNSSIWDHTLGFFPDPVISVQQAAAAIADRQVKARAENPEFNMTAGDKTAMNVETSLYLLTFVDEAQSVQKEWVDVLFTEERLPIEEGWVKPTTEVSVPMVLAKVAEIGNALPLPK
ncbi:hypothetical protein HYFRA_00013419 [Hymenoscyphus fraxineus]|uniref:Heme haloperoxidase family profile domain-containing protein n=1 Tax=Hymenoscyphus fraxineus TaxID=746836 RepID=A0A9N9L5A6_9HELO|nr:hypothetical protein HYFRA_00013419 [Hymenoscyphus fraxineus]